MCLYCFSLVLTYVYDRVVVSLGMNRNRDENRVDPVDLCIYL